MTPAIATNIKAHPSLEFLKKLDGSLDPIFGYRILPDKKTGEKGENRFGHFLDLQEELTRFNQQGRGIFHTVNVLNGKGYSGKDIIGIRGFFVDLDGSPIEPILKFKLLPQIVAISSPGRFHGYWILNPKDREAAIPFFEQIQLAIISKFNGDKVIHDLPRIMRTPFFFHNKKEPFLSTVMPTDETRANYSLAEILEAFEISKKEPIKPKKSEPLPEIIPIGQQETRLMSFLGSMRRAGATEESMMAAIQIENHRCIPPVQIADLERMVHSVARYKPTEGDFIRDKDGKIYANNQQNIENALNKLGIIVSYNTFADRLLFKKDGGPEQLLDDPPMDRFWLEIDSTFNFRPSQNFFATFLKDRARQNSFHPVRDYFAALNWDQIGRASCRERV